MMNDILILRVDIAQNSIKLWTNKNILKFYNVDMNLLNKDIIKSVGTELNFECTDIDIINSYRIYNKTQSFIIKGLLLIEKIESTEIFYFNSINYLNVIKNYFVIRTEDQILLIKINDIFNTKNIDIKNKNKLSIYKYKKNALVILNNFSMISRYDKDTIIFIK